MNRHTTTIHARCPFVPVWDYYTVEFTTDKIVQCEVLEEACDTVRGAKIPQEEICERLKSAVPNHTSVKVTGRHGANCLTEVTL